MMLIGNWIQHWEGGDSGLPERRLNLFKSCNIRRYGDEDVDEKEEEVERQRWRWSGAVDLRLNPMHRINQEGNDRRWTCGE